MVKKYTNSFIVYIKLDDIYKVIGENFEIRFDTSNYKLGKPLTKGKNKKVTGLLKDILGAKIITKFFELRAKSYST